MKYRFNFFLVLIFITVLLIGCERPIRRTSTNQDVQSYATKSAIEVIEGKVFVPTRDAQLLSDLNIRQDQIAEVTQPATTVEPSTTPEPSNTPEPTNTVEPTSTPEPSRTPTLAPTDTPEPVEEPTEVVEIIETEGSVDNDENDKETEASESTDDPAEDDAETVVDESSNNNEDEPETTPVVIIAQTVAPTATPNWVATQNANNNSGAQPTATPNWVATQNANNNANGVQPTATPNWVATQNANNSANGAQPTATPNWVATQTAANAGGATNDNTDSSTADNIFYHTVQAQENLFRIGLLYNVPWPLIAAANEITDESGLEVGDRIVIPFLNSDGSEQTADNPAQPTDTNTAPAATPVPPAATEQLTYVVQQGDTLYSISRSFGLTTEAVATANGIVNPEVIEVGMVLVIPVPNVDLPDAPEQYVVVAGDTLYQIGMRFGVSWREIATINNIVSPFNIEVGQTLVIP